MKKLVLILLLLQFNLYGGRFFQYKVQTEETLKVLSDKFNVEIDDILNNNKIINKDLLIKGQVLNIPFNYSYQPPQKKDIQSILNSSNRNWNNPLFEVYQWDYNGEVLIFDTLNYSIQSLMFKRLAYYVEKKDHAGKIFTYEELRDKRGWNGHDYKGRDLARFYNKVKDLKLELTNGEKALLKILVENKIIVETPYGYRDGGGVVLSISQSSYYSLRKSIMNHEILHALYFTSAEFRVYSAIVWNTISKRNRDIWNMYLDILGYDTTNKDLVINEFVAYMLQNSNEETYKYLREVAYYRLVSNYPEERDKIDAFYTVSKKPYSLQIVKLRKFANRVFKNLY